MHCLPLFYLNTLSDGDIAIHQCSDRIWLGQHAFEHWMTGADVGVAVILTVTNGVDQTVVGSIYGVHHDDPDVIYMPSWMMEMLDHDHEHIRLSRATPGLCTGLMLQPHTSTYADATDPQEVLRNGFENYSCLIPGTTVPVWIDAGEPLYVTVMEVRPNTGDVRCIRNCEIELELMRPLDLPLPVPPRMDPAPTPEPVAEPEPAPAQDGIRLGGTIPTGKTPRQLAAEAAQRRLHAAHS